MATKPAAATALSLHIGLNAVSAAAYEGWDGQLAACEFDAKDVTAIARGRGMKPTTLLTKKATRAALLAAMRKAAKALRSGDLFSMTYSGHGGHVPDTNGDEPDRKDETWCLDDGQLIDDELYLKLSKFEAGVRVLVPSDSCHSGSVTRDRVAVLLPGQRAKMMPTALADAFTPRAMPSTTDCKLKWPRPRARRRPTLTPRWRRWPFTVQQPPRRRWWAALLRQC